MLICSEYLWKDPEDAGNSVALGGGTERGKAGPGTGSGRQTSLSLLPCFILFLFFVFLLAYSINFKVLCILIRQGLISAYVDGDGPPWGREPLLPVGCAQTSSYIGAEKLSWGPLE